MRAYPRLVPEKLCRTEAEISFTKGIDSDGAPKTVFTFSGKCNYSEKSRQVMSADRQLIELSACALFNGDIAPGIDLEGEALIKNAGAPDVIRRIYRGERARNPDGSVNFTKLELI